MFPRKQIMCNSKQINKPDF